jgi:hypothetical protein
MDSSYPQAAWYGPAPLVPSAPPRAVNRAVRLMRAGAALAVVYGAVYGLTRHALVGGILSGVIAGLVWLWMAWKSNAGRNWARVLSSIFFGATIPGLFGSIADRRWAPALVVFLIECGVGLAAVILLWRPESGQFFAAARQAKLADREQLLGDTHPDTLTSRNNLAMAYRAAGRLAEALPLYERTLADREQLLGDTHPDTLSCRNNLASAYYEAGRLAEAIPLYERTLADREQVLGDTHPNTLTSRNNLALAYRAAGRLAEAEDLQKRAESES